MDLAIRSRQHAGASRAPLVVLRHGQGRRLPVPRVQRLPAGRDLAPTSSTSASPRACRSPASTAACSTTAPSAARRCPAPSTPAARPASSCCSAPTRRWRGRSTPGNVEHAPAHRDARPGRRRRPGPRHRGPRPGHRRGHARTSADAVVLATGGYGNVFYLSTNAKGCNATAIWRAHKRGALLGQPVLHPDPPDLHPGQRRPPVQAHPDERVAAQRRPHLGADDEGRRPRRPTRSPRPSATTSWSDLPALRQPGAPRRRVARGQERRATRAAASGPAGRGVYLDFADAIARLGRAGDRASATATCSTCTSGSPARTRTRCRCASTRPSTTRWAGCGSTTTCRATIPGLFVIGEANFSDHGANRLGARALMQGLADGYFVLPSTLGDYLAGGRARRPSTRPPGGRARPSARSTTRLDRLLVGQGHAHGRLLPPRARHADVGALRHGPQRGGPAQGAGADPASCARSSGRDVNVPGQRRGAQPGAGEGRPGGRLPRARRAHVPRRAAPRGVLRRPLPRGDQTADGEALRDDEHFAYVAAWEFTGAGRRRPSCTRSRSSSSTSTSSQRSYK